MSYTITRLFYIYIYTENPVISKDYRISSYKICEVKDSIGDDIMGKATLKTVLLSGVLFVFAGFTGYFCARRKFVDILKTERENNAKLLEFFQLLVRWHSVKRNGKEVSKWLKCHGINTIAIYGMKELGDLLYRDLTNEGFDVRYGIDRNADNILTTLRMVSPQDKLEPVDAVIVTAIHYFDEIENDIKNKAKGRILSLEDILFEMEACEY